MSDLNSVIDARVEISRLQHAVRNLEAQLTRERLRVGEVENAWMLRMFLLAQALITIVTVAAAIAARR